MAGVNVCVCECLQKLKHDSVIEHVITRIRNYFSNCTLSLSLSLWFSLKCRENSRNHPSRSINNVHLELRTATEYN